MELIHLQDIRCEVKDRTLFHIDHVAIYPKDRIGLVGRNGSGKTALLNVIAGNVEPTSGTVDKNAEVSLLPQLKPWVKQKSGGEISQAIIYETLAKEVGVLLADEPTTHLDMENVEKLERQLKERKEAIIVVSHDRAFLDTICTQIWEIEDGKVHFYTGNYTDYEQQKLASRKNHEKEYEKYVQKRKQLEEAMHQKEQKAQRATKKPKDISSSEVKITGAKPYFAKKQKKLNQGVKAIQSRISQLDKVEKIKELPPIKMQVAHEEKLKNRTIIRGKKVARTVGDRLLWKEFDFTITAGDKVAVIGPNGSGKTTFLRMILEEADGIYVSPSVSLGYFSQMLEVLDVKESILDNVRKTSTQDQTLIRIILARLGFFRDDVFKPVHVLSGGERVKVALGKLFVSDANVLILDEPTNYLDIEAVESLESLLVDYPGTVLFVSHDRRFLENTSTKVFSFQDKRIYSFEGKYEEYVKAQAQPAAEHTPLKEEMLKVEMEITNVLSQLSIGPTEELDQTFQKLLRQKKNIKQQLDRENE
ncbi:ABC transporter [Anaerobacillus alkalidiazotrophicus]|uniref:ABC transporter n=1 Tax=Anaerobacillus alkalidiazotrophicus TaxID=472963 RepID=A0A1S2MCZ4_9BACI|nr:ABC-F type ribosomal protection protein [Anaerobacillus alkalidiazotrophicus]OIJ22470.1 ABC transporter [Anaerobacillus alkalidiazotrophicus]